MNVMNETLAAWIMFLNFYFCLPICWSTGNKQCEKAISRSLNNSCTCFYLHCSFGFVLSNAFSHNSAQRYILISSSPLKIFWLSYTCHYNPLLITNQQNFQEFYYIGKKSLQKVGWKKNTWIIMVWVLYLFIVF